MLNKVTAAIVGLACIGLTVYTKGYGFTDFTFWVGIVGSIILLENFA